jgi:cephalosporin hydroxylase
MSKPRLPATLVNALRRLAGSRSVYEWSAFCDRPIDAMTLQSVFGERPEGGWRSFAGTVVERKWSDIFTIDVFLARTSPATIVELGTGSGGFSSYLATYAYLSGASFSTFDTHRKTSPTKRPNYRALRLIRALGGRVYHRDIFAPDTRKLIGRLAARPGATFLYCDNGDKPREAQLFAEALKPGDFLGVHDFNTEILPADVAGQIERNILHPWHPEFFEALSSSNRIFQRPTGSGTS